MTDLFSRRDGLELETPVEKQRKRVTHFVEMRREDGRFFEVIFRRQLERILARRRTLVKD
jgi:hypothetical protein